MIPFAGWWRGLQEQTDRNLDRERLKKDMDSQALRDALAQQAFEQSKVSEANDQAYRQETLGLTKQNFAAEQADRAEAQQGRARARFLEDASMGITDPNSDPGRSAAAKAGIDYSLTGETPLPEGQAGPPEPQRTAPKGLSDLYAVSNRRQDVNKAYTTAMRAITMGKPDDPAVNQALATLEMLSAETPEAADRAAELQERITSIKRSLSSDANDSARTQIAREGLGLERERNDQARRGAFFSQVDDLVQKDDGVRRAGAALEAAYTRLAAGAGHPDPNVRIEADTQVKAANVQHELATAKARLDALNRVRASYGNQLSADETRQIETERLALKQRIRDLSQASPETSGGGGTIQALRSAMAP